MTIRTSDKLGFTYNINVIGKSIRLVEYLPGDQNPYTFEECSMAPQEYIALFELTGEELEAFREMLKNISLKIARMRNA